jgi:predicted secreted protein
MKRIAFTFILALFILSGCSKSSQPKFGADINGNIITCSSDQNFMVDLVVHSDSGYQWFAKISDTNVVKLENIDYAAKSDQQVTGGLAVATLFFQPIKSGQCTINLNERRDWEKELFSINKIEFRVTVKEK